MIEYYMKPNQLINIHAVICGTGTIYRPPTERVSEARQGTKRVRENNKTMLANKDGVNPLAGNE